MSLARATSMPIASAIMRAIGGSFLDDGHTVEGDASGVAPIVPLAAGPFSDSNYFQSASGSLAGWDLGALSTLVVVLNPYDPGPYATSYSPICYRHPSAVGAHGWGLFITANTDAPIVGMYYIAGSAVLKTNLGSISRIPGVPTRIVFVDDGTNFRVTVNGSPIITAARATYSAGTSTERATLGNFLGSANFPLAHDLVASFAILHRAVSDAEAIVESSLLAQWSISLAIDAQCTVEGNATRDYPIAQANWLTGGSSPTTLVKAGAVPSTAVAPGAYTTVSLDTARPEDTSMWTAVVGGAYGNYHRTTNEPRWLIDTDAEEIIVKQIVTEGASYYTAISARIVGGATLTRVVNGAFAFPYPMTAAFIVGTGGTPKVLEITPSAQSASGAIAAFVGGFPISVSVPPGRSCVVRAATVPTRRLVVVVDSIGTGQLASNPELLGAFALARLDYPGQITIDGAIARSLYDEINSGLGQAGLVASIVAGLDGSVTNEIYIQISTNDFGLSGGLWTSLVTMTSAVAAFLTALRAATAAPIYLQTMDDRTDYAANTNSRGQTITAFRAAWAAGAVGIANVTVVAGALFELAGDGAHFTTAGHAAKKAAIKTTLGY